MEDTTESKLAQVNSSLVLIYRRISEGLRYHEEHRPGKSNILLWLWIQRLLGKMDATTTDLVSGTLPADRESRLALATIAVRHAQVFIYTVAVGDDSWQNTGDPMATAYFQAICEASRTRKVDVRRIYVSKSGAILDDMKPDVREKIFPNLAKQIDAGIEIRTARAADVELAVGKGLVLNMLICDRDVVTWQFPATSNPRIEGAISFEERWINEYYESFRILLSEPISQRFDLDAALGAAI